MIRTPTAQNRAQVMRALEFATEVRLERARYKRWIALMEPDLGAAECAAVIYEPPPLLAGMLTRELVLAIRRFGKHKAGLLLTKARVHEQTTLGSLTPRQRDALRAELVDARAE